MSSFICEPRTIERIVTYILNSGVPTFAGIGGNLSAGDAIGQKLMALNATAFNSRYKSAEPMPVYHHATRAASNVQVAKSIACLLYQCSEGSSIEANPTYVALLALENQIAWAIVRALPEYEKAEWA
jgi:hypothetical protein